MGESSRVERENGGPAGTASRSGTAGRSGTPGYGHPNEQLGLPLSEEFEAEGNDPSERLMLALEGRVIGLMERFDEARKRISALEVELAERDSLLQASADQHELLKQRLRERLGGIIERITELEARESSRGPEE